MIDGTALAEFMGESDYPGGVIPADDLPKLERAASAATSVIAARIDAKYLTADAVELAILLQAKDYYQGIDSASFGVLSLGDYGRKVGLNSIALTLIDPYKRGVIIK